MDWFGMMHGVVEAAAAVGQRLETRGSDQEEDSAGGGKREIRMS